MDILQMALAEKERVADYRNTLHRQPELSGCETQTMQFVCDELDALGISWEPIAHGGILGRISGRGPGKTLLLRGDMDALPVAEDPQNLLGPKQVVSECAGVSHACGHDAHTAMLLVSARLLAACRSEWDGQILLMFEQGEETSYGALAILEHLQKNVPEIDGCFALHVQADIPQGMLSAQPGAVMSGVVSYDVTLRGKGGHSSRPDQCNHPLDCFMAIYQAMHQLRMRYISPFECLTYTVGLLEAGKKSNIIPETLHFAGLARFFDYEKCGVPFRREFTHIISECASLYHCEASYGYLKGPTLSLVNNPDCSRIAQRAVTGCLGPDAWVAAPPWMASETMGYYTYLYPGVMMFLGIRNETCGMGSEHHSAKFDLDSAVLYRGVAATVAYATEFLANPDPVAAARPTKTLAELTQF